MSLKGYHSCKIKFIDIYYNLRNIFNKKDKEKYIKRFFNSKFKTNASYDRFINEFNRQILFLPFFNNN